MSTTFELAKQQSDDVVLLFDVTEQFPSFHVGLEVSGVLDEEQDLSMQLSADEALAAAIKLINVVLYSYPERHTEVIEQVRNLRC